MVMALAAAGCAKTVENTLEEAIERQLEEEGDSGDVDIEIDEDNGSVSIETDEGSVQIGGNDIPDDFPLPVPDYEEISGVVTQSEGSTSYTQVILSFDPDDFDDVADLYEDFFNDEGWEVTRTNSSGDGQSLAIISGTNEEVNASAVIAYSDDDEVASLSLSYGTDG
jgi:hypothetical protein